ncbi:MAG: nuclear transport factor 2 family protein [Bacteroidota bacterium]
MKIFLSKFNFTVLASIFLFFYTSNSDTKSASIENPDKIEIENTIQMYFDGWLTGDTTLIGTAMHSTCKLKTLKNEKVAIYDRSTYLSFFEPRPKLENAEGRILTIDITGPAASAKVELETAERLFTDYFNLLKEKDRWYIMDKISTNVAK